MGLERKLLFCWANKYFVTAFEEFSHQSTDVKLAINSAASDGPNEVLVLRNKDTVQTSMI